VTLEERRRRFGILAVAAALATAVACGGSGYSSSPTPMPTPTPSSTPAAADVTITINGMAGDQSFSPSPGAAKPGQTVAWRNADSVTHTATGTGFDTGSIAPGATSSPIAFATAGTFQYHCTIHPSMVGTLNVAQ